MNSLRSLMSVVLVVFGAIVVETTVFGRVNIDGIAPDVVMLTIVMLALRLRPEGALLVGFVAGLVLDTLGSSALGLRAFTLTVVAFIAVRTRDRADFSPLAAAIWSGVLVLVGVALFVTVGTLVGQVPLDGSEALRRVLLVPLMTFLVALLAWPVFARLIEPVRRTL